MATLNSKIQGRTIEEWREDNKEIINCPINCECGVIFQKRSLARHNQRKPHQDYLKQLEDPTYTIITPGETCECGGRYTKSDKAKHMKTLKHQNYLKTCM